MTKLIGKVELVNNELRQIETSDFVSKRIVNIIGLLGFIGLGLELVESVGYRLNLDGATVGVGLEQENKSCTSTPRET